MSAEFMGPIHQSATAFHEAYLTFVEVGFTTDQAFEMTLLMVKLSHGAE